jgi:hypothetical protein
MRPKQALTGAQLSRTSRAYFRQKKSIGVAELYGIAMGAVDYGRVA